MQQIADEVGDPLCEQDNAQGYTAKDTPEWVATNGLNCYNPLFPRLYMQQVTNSSLTITCFSLIPSGIAKSSDAYLHEAIARLI